MQIKKPPLREAVFKTVCCLTYVLYRVAILITSASE